MVRSSSKSIIKDHGGKIWAEVNLGRENATFSFSSSLGNIKYRYKTKKNGFIVIFYFAVRTKN
jgi:ribosomal protein L27